eukprot:5290010-Prymnesium_polylepis.1
MASATDLREMLVGAMPAATSKLVVDKPFVLRHLNRGYGPEVMIAALTWHTPCSLWHTPFVLRHLNRGYGAEVMAKTLLADQLGREKEAM